MVTAFTLIPASLSDTLIWRATLLTELRVVLTYQGKLADGRLCCPTPEVGLGFVIFSGWAGGQGRQAPSCLLIVLLFWGRYMLEWAKWSKILFEFGSWEFLLKFSWISCCNLTQRLIKEQDWTAASLGKTHLSQRGRSSFTVWVSHLSCLDESRQGT